MNIQQLEYILAVNTHRHFSKAADACFVTQPTLSMMIHKLEDELGVKIFDRNVSPVVPTQIGLEIILQAKVVLQEVSRMRDLINQTKNEIRGEYRVGIIPTVAPYLLPLFLPSFIDQYPDLQLKIIELQTATILEELNKQNIDAAILASPLNEKDLVEEPLYYEKFYAYVSTNEKISSKEVLESSDIDLKRLWLLNDGHCFRTQIIRFCDLKKKIFKDSRVGFEYEAGSLQTLMSFVEQGRGLTIIPELAVAQLHDFQKQFVRPFVEPFPIREISLVYKNGCAKMAMKRVLADAIRNSVPREATNPIWKKNVISVF